MPSDNKVYFGRQPANRKPRLEPFAKLRRGSPFTQPRARVEGKCGDKLALQVQYHSGRNQLLVVTLRKAEYGAAIFDTWRRRDFVVEAKHLGISEFLNSTRPQIGANRS